MPEPSAVRRRFPRLKMLGNVTGEVSLLHDVTLLDLGEGGARLEHAGRFALNAICFLRVPAPEGELLLKARVIHSAVSRTAPGPGEETVFKSDPVSLDTGLIGWAWTCRSSASGSELARTAQM